MLFNSYQFLIFFPIVTIAYFVLPYRFRWALLLVASVYFYMAWEPAYVVLLFISAIVDYFAGLLMSVERFKRIRLLFLLLSLFIDLGILFFFKYYNFFSSSLERLFTALSIPSHLPESGFLLPIGISFYTFQALSYTIDVYRGKKSVERNLGTFMLYVMFYPQLVAGPIERARNLLPQLKLKYDFDYIRVTDGLKLMAWGMFKKVAIADRLAPMVDSIYGNPQNHSGPSFVIATLFFAFQIYCDFSGYTDIAIGAAQVMGIRLMKNFERPYFAKSIPEFWRRWHISLSTWFRDYLYIPLGGNRVTIPRWYLNIFIVFLLSGLWHGANWTFLIWGMLHGVYIMLSKLLNKPTANIIKIMSLDRKPLLLKLIQIFLTFLLVNFGWIFFRSSSLSDAFYIVSHLGDGWILLSSLSGLKSIFIGFGVTKVQFILAWMLIFFLIYIQMIQRTISVRQMLSEKPSWVRWCAYYCLIIALLLFGVFNENQFIYFQF